MLVDEFTDDCLMGYGFWCRGGGFLPKSSYGKFWSILEVRDSGMGGDGG